MQVGCCMCDARHTKMRERRKHRSIKGTCEPLTNYRRPTSSPVTTVRRTLGELSRGNEHPNASGPLDRHRYARLVDRSRWVRLVNKPRWVGFLQKKSFQAR